MTTETQVNSLRPADTRATSVRAPSGVSASGISASGISSVSAIQPISPTGPLGRAFSQLLQTANPERTERTPPREKEPGRSLLSTEAQFLLAENRMQEAQALFPAPTNVSLALSTYSDVQTRIGTANAIAGLSRQLAVAS